MATDKINDFKLTKNFNLREFASHSTGEVKISNKLVSQLQKVRNQIDKPIIITSAYRTKRDNKRVGGVENSQHLRGLAVDISAIGHNKFVLRTFLKQAGFKEVILYSKANFIHAGLLEK